MPKPEPKIHEFMTQQPQTIDASATVDEAKKLLSRFEVRHLPVTRNGKVVGILSEREINLVHGMDAIDPKQLLVIDISSEDPFMVGPDEPLREVAMKMAEKHYGSALVMEAGKLVGIFTTVDACYALAELIETGIEKVNKTRINRFRRRLKE